MIFPYSFLQIVTFLLYLNRNFLDQTWGIKHVEVVDTVSKH